MKMQIACATLVMAALLSACVMDVDESDARLGEVEQAAHHDDTPQICVLTLDCGGFCGTFQQLQVFLKKCDAKNKGNGPVGPCFSQCWNPCQHAHSNGPNLIACTEQCMVGNCPANAGGLSLSAAP